MPSFKIAHIRQQGVDLIIVPLADSFRWKSDDDQIAIAGELQLRAQAAGLAGTVVPVWDAGGGRMGFRAPRNWHSFFKSIGLWFVGRNINRKLWW